jgi:hypothetical protein
MPPENAPTSPAPAARATVINPPAPLFLPWAHHFHTGLSDEILAEIDAFNPVKADSVHLEIAKDTARKMIDAMPPEARGAEVRMECVGHDGKQILVQVTPKLIKKP